MNKLEQNSVVLILGNLETPTTYYHSA